MWHMTLNEAERYFRHGGSVVRHYRSMPKTFETTDGRLMSRALVHQLWSQGKLTASASGRHGAVYSWRQAG
jgi:hypothetical protein